MITVATDGEKCDILVLSGPLAEGSFSLAAAERETIACSHCMLTYKKLNFKEIQFLGGSRPIRYLVQ